MAGLSIKTQSILKSTWIGTYLRKRRWNKSILSEKRIEREIEKHIAEATPARKESVRRDIKEMAKKYRFSPEEYFYYHFENLPEEKRKEFISDLNRVIFCESLNKAKNLVIFDDKQKSYEYFSEYYGRDVCGVKSAKDEEKLFELVDKHGKFIFKPLAGTCGRGIQIMDFSGLTTEEKKKALKSMIVANTEGKNNGFIVEELVIQAKEMAQFHPESLNTVRIATVKFDDGVQAIAACLRIGRGESIVDNAGAGGMIASIDMESGVIDAVGDEFGNSYEAHPDTNVLLKGFCIPRWSEAVELAKKLASVVDGNRYAGWDLALTDSGWVMIEGNARGQFIWQIPTQKGFLKQTNEILVRLGKKPMKKLSI